MKLVPIPITIYTNNEDSQNSPGLTSQELPTFPVGPLNEVQAIKIALLTIDSAFTSMANLLAPINSDSAVDSAASISVVNSPAPVDLEPTKFHSHSPCTLDSIGDLSPSRAAGDQSTEFVQSTARNRGNGDADVIMADDMNLPVYISHRDDRLFACSCHRSSLAGPCDALCRI